MDKSKLAGQDVTINYDMWKFDHGTPKLSRGIKTQCHCHGECWCGEDGHVMSDETADPLDIENPCSGGKIK